MIGVPLRQQRYRAKLEVRIAWIANGRWANFVVQYPIEPPGIADHRGRLVAERKHRHRFVRRGRLAEKIDPALSLPGVLVAQQCENATAFEHALDIGPATFFGEDVLAGAAAEVVHKAVEIRVVE